MDANGQNTNIERYIERFNSYNIYIYSIYIYINYIYRIPYKTGPQCNEGKSKWTHKTTNSTKSHKMDATCNKSRMTWMCNLRLPICTSIGSNLSKCLSGELSPWFEFKLSDPRAKITEPTPKLRDSVKDPSCCKWRGWDKNAHRNTLDTKTCVYLFVCENIANICKYTSWITCFHTYVHMLLSSSRSAFRLMKVL